VVVCVCPCAHLCVRASACVCVCAVQTWGRAEQHAIPMIGGALPSTGGPLKPAPVAPTLPPAAPASSSSVRPSSLHRRHPPCPLLLPPPRPLCAPQACTSGTHLAPCCSRLLVLCAQEGGPNAALRVHHPHPPPHLDGGHKEVQLVALRGTQGGGGCRSVVCAWGRIEGVQEHGVRMGAHRMVPERGVRVGCAQEGA